MRHIKLPLTKGGPLCWEVRWAGLGLGRMECWDRVKY